MTAQEFKDLRRKCCTDLFFLTKHVLGKDLEEQPHRQMCAFFVVKDPSKPPAAADETKQHLLMCPRGSFKSTINVCDAVQWTIAYPNIRILVLTAEKNLAGAFAEEYRNYFTVQKDAPTEFQKLFPEFCVKAGKKEPSAEFTTPARTQFKKEPTLWSNSIGSNLPGWHCDVLILDDCVNDKNSENPEQIEKVIKSFNFTRKLVDPGGYINVIGTPYAPTDLYDYIQKNSEEGSLKVFAQSAWSVKPESKHKKADQLGKDDYDLFFPARLTYEFLSKEKRYDPVTFESQYMINARNAAKQLFPEDLVRGQIIPWQSIPQQLNYYAAWDLAYGEGLLTNFTAGIVAATDNQGRLYILDLVRGRFNGTNLVFQIADIMRRYPLQLTAIEDMLGAKWLEPEIDRVAVKLGVQPRIHWLPVERQKDAKIARISRLVPMFSDGRIFISDAVPGLEELIEGFINFTGGRNSQDDIPDAVSFFPRFVSLQAQPTSAMSEQYWQQIQREALYQILYPVAPPPIEQESSAEPTVNLYF